MKQTKLPPAQEECRKRILASYSDYHNAVEFIASFEALMVYAFGKDGKYGHHLLKCDRFPVYSSLTPDLLLRFRNGYVLLAEQKKTFQQNSADDVAQVRAYASLQFESDVTHHDVILFVSITSAFAARGAVRDDRTQPSSQISSAPIVVMGFYRDRDRVNGDWINIKWEPYEDNLRFSEHNVVPAGEGGNLNMEFCDQEYVPIKVTPIAVLSAERQSLINDEPPPIYTCIHVLVPHLIASIDEKKRDQFYRGGIEVDVDPENICARIAQEGVTLRRIRAALDVLVEGGLAKRMESEQAVIVRVKIDKKFQTSDLADDLAVRLAKVRSRGKPAAATKSDAGQPSLFGDSIELPGHPTPELGDHQT